MPENIYLTGFMGSGKSRVGRELASALGRPHLDTDELFQEKLGVSPGDFIRQNGEESFRKEEQEILRQVAKERVFCVISTGGGLPVYPGNRRIMKESGVTATLQIPLEQIAARLSEQEKASRPLWDEERYRQRQPFYLDCEYTLDATRTPAEIVAEFRTKASDFLRQAPRKAPGFQRLLRQCAKDCAEYRLLQEGDRILVGLSGGEDSFLLLELLQALAKKTPFHFSVIAANIDVGYPGFDATPIAQYCQERGWEFHHRRVPALYELLSPEKVGNKPCALCSRLRRGQLHYLLKELSCNKLALGQHLDDLCVSFLMSLFHGGGLKTMGPNVPADGGNARLIRPLWGLRKPAIHEAAELFGFPKPQSCPYQGLLDERGDRHFLEQLLQDLETRFPHLHEAMRKSLRDLRPQHLLDPRFLDCLKPQEPATPGRGKDATF